jgi:hypothetical protein
MASYQSSFTGTENPLLELGAWLQPGAWQLLQKSTGAFVTLGASNSGMMLTGTVIGNAQFSEVTFTGTPTAADWYGCMTRIQSKANGSCYVVIQFSGAAILYKCVDTGTLAFTQLGTGAVTPNAGTNTLHLESSGNNHTVKFNGVTLYTVSGEASFPSGSVGLSVYDADGSGGSVIASFNGGDIGSSDTIPLPLATTRYENASPLAAHTTAAMNTTGTNFAFGFFSYHPVWLSLPISVTSITDSNGNAWHRLAGPTENDYPTFNLISEIWYSALSIVGAGYTVTASFNNPVPLAISVLAIQNAGNKTPVASAITGSLAPGTDVVSASVTALASSLLVAWAKNETGPSAAVAQGTFAQDPASSVSIGSAFIWAEWERMTASGGATGHFTYSASINWQTAIVAVSSQSNVPATGSDDANTLHMGSSRGLRVSDGNVAAGG